MNCEYCGKPVGLLRRLKSNRYCSAEHQAADDVNPASMVLKTLLQNGPPPRGTEPEARTLPAGEPSSSGVKQGSAIPAGATPIEEAEDAAFLSSLLGDPEPETHVPEGAPPEPPSSGFAMELPAARWQGSGYPPRPALAPKCLEMDWVDCLGELAMGTASSALAVDPQLPFGQTSTREIPGPDSDEAPWASFVQGVQALNGTVAPAANLDWLRTRPGTRPVHASLLLTAPLVSGWEYKVELESTQPSTQTEPVCEPDLQDSLMAMLMKLPG